MSDQQSSGRRDSTRDAGAAHHAGAGLLGEAVCPVSAYRPFRRPEPVIAQLYGVHVLEEMGAAARHLNRPACARMFLLEHLASVLPQ